MEKFHSLLKEKYDLLLPHLDEKSRRLYLSSETISLGRGGKSLVSRLTKVSRVTLTSGEKELRLKLTSQHKKEIRKKGGGRKKASVLDNALTQAVKDLVNPHTLGDPMSPLLWTSKSTRKLEQELKCQGFIVSYNVVNRILKSEGFSLQSNRKTDEGGKHEDRDVQFTHINNTTIDFIASGDPVISVDCKKKELVGNFKNAGKEWGLKGSPKDVKVYDFIDKTLGKALPYGVYDVCKNEGWMSVGVNFDTAKFAVSSIRNWWYEMGVNLYGSSNRIYINADGGGSNSSRSRLWKTELQILSNELNKEIHVSHFPPGTSKWNKIEHKMFSFISMNWRAKPLTSLQVIVNLIANTTTKNGLKIKTKIDETIYQKGIKISDKELAEINIIRNEFHGEWNYIIKPKL